MIANHDPVPGISPILDGFRRLGCRGFGSGRRDGFRRLTIHVRNWTSRVGKPCCTISIASPTPRAERGIRAVVHPHVGTMIEQRDEVLRVLDGSAIPLCLDTGHLLIGGTDPVDLARQAPERNHPRASQGRRRCPRITRSQR